MANHHWFFGSAGSQDADYPQYGSYSADFNGTDEYVTFGDIAGLEIQPDDSFSISVWVKPSDTGKTQIAGKKAAGSLQGWGFRRGAAAIRWQFEMYDTAVNYIYRQSNAGPVADTWTHVCVSYDGSDTYTGIHFWIDGISDDGPGAGSGTVGDTASGGDFQIGKWGPGVTSNFDGVMGDFVFMPFALTQGLVDELYNGGKEFDLSSNFSQWATMNASSSSMWINWEADDLDVGDQPGVTDLTDNGYTGTATNMTTATNKVSDVP